MTENRQNHDQQEQHYQRYQQKNHNEVDHYNYNNNYYNNPNGAGRALTECDQQLLKEAYCDNIGTMTGAAAKLLENAFDGGLTVDELVMAIEETGLAPRPSAYYLKAILENWARNGVTVSKMRHQIKANRAMKWWKD